MNEKKSSTSQTKPESIHISLKFRPLGRLMFGELISIFQTWFVIVYHPREFFLRFFDRRFFHIKFDTTIFLGLTKFNIDTKQQKLLNPLMFASEAGTISVLSLASIIYMYNELPLIDQQSLPSLPVLLALPFANEILIAVCITVLIILVAYFMAFYLFIFCKKGTSMKALINFSVYTVTAWTVSVFIGLSVCMLLLLTASNYYLIPGISIDGPGIPFFLISLFTMYAFVLFYISIENTLRLFIVNVIIVLREILKEKVWIILFILGCPVIVFVAIQFAWGFFYDLIN